MCVCMCPCTFQKECIADKQKLSIANKARDFTLQANAWWLRAIPLYLADYVGNIDLRNTRKTQNIKTSDTPSQQHCLLPSPVIASNAKAVTSISKSFTLFFFFYHLSAIQRV